MVSTNRPAWISAPEAQARQPLFFRRRQRKGDAWTINPRNHKRIESRFGFGEVRVQLSGDGSPGFDRLVYGEAPNINCVVYGKDNNGNYKIANVVQARPFADMPDGSPASPPIPFGQGCVMGFRDNLGGTKTLEKAFEAADDAAVREALEEAGAKAILGIKHMGHHNPNPTFCATWSELFEIEVDLTKLVEFTDRNELIYRAEYVPVMEMLRRIGEGEHDGVNYRSATANDAFFVWLARHPEALAA